MTSTDRKELIEEILEHDILIQGYVEEDDFKTFDELQILSDDELSDGMTMRTVYLKHLMDDDMIH